MLGLGAVPSIFLAIGVLAMPESPRWLVMQGRLDDARQVLDLTSDSLEDSRMRLDDIMQAAGLLESSRNDVVLITERSRGKGVWKELLLNPTPAIRHVLIAGVGVHLLQQASGTDAVVLYSPRIFEKAGLRKDSDQLLATVAVGVSKLMFTLAATFLVDWVGRRPLLLTSCGGVAASLLGLAVGLAAADGRREATWATGLCVATSLSCIAFFSIGMGPVAWVYSSEVFPLRLRAQGCAVGVAVNRLTSAVVSMTFISLYETITIGGAFFLYAGIAGVSWIFFYKVLPETRGKTLEEIETLFGSFSK